MERIDDWHIYEGSIPGLDPAGLAECGAWAEQYPAPESVFALSNGYLGIRAAPEEVIGQLGAGRGTFINGWFERSPISYGEGAFGYPRWHETIVAAPDGSGVRVFVDGHVPKPWRPLETGRWLDLRKGVLCRRALYALADSKVLEITSERFVSLARQGLAAIRLRIKVRGGGTVRVSSVLDASPSNASQGDDPRLGAKFAGAPYELASSGTEGDCLHCVARTVASGLSLAAVVINEARIVHPAANGRVSRSYPVSGQAPEPGQAGLYADYAATLEEGDELVLIKYLSYRRDAACGAAGRGRNGGISLPEELLRQARLDADSGAGIGFDALLTEHIHALDEFWKAADIELDGPAGLAASVRLNLFHVFQAAGRDGVTNVPAKGLSGEGYEGHAFWDTEIYLMPLLTYTAPDIAKNLVRYRAATLDAARQRARELAHKQGALFAWRTISGMETSAYFPAGTAQYHINADIAYAAWRYIKASGDGALLEGAGLDLLVETARLWMDTGHYGRDGRFRIDEVTGPDEYSALVNNNAYTNAMARFNLRAAAQAVSALRESGSGAWDNAAARLDLQPGEDGAWLSAAASMYLPYDDESGVIPQDDSFMDRAPWDLAATPKDKFPLLLHYHPLAIYRRRVLKQPDLLLAMLLLSSEFSLADKKRNFKFYEPLTTGDSSLSHCIMSVLAAETGDAGKAWDYFTRTVRMDLDDLHGNASHGVHIAAMGGSWLSLVYGFAGFRDDGGRYRFSPLLPPELKRLGFALRLAGGTLSVRVTHQETHYRWTGDRPLEIGHHADTLVLQPGVDVVAGQKPRLRAVIFDLDGVIADTAELHFLAWKRLADEEKLTFGRRANEALKGRSRMESLDLILGHKAGDYSQGQKLELADRKNGYYRDLVASLTPADVLPGARELLDALRSRGIRVGLASASRNAPDVLERLGLGGSFDARGDPASARPKPDPELFLDAAQRLGARRLDCVAIEDAQAGIDAILAADMKAVAVGGKPQGAHKRVRSLSELRVEDLEKLFR